MQYANVLCAALEQSELGLRSIAQIPAFTTLPQNFKRLLDNELNPTEVVAQDLYPLKQRAQAGPHREFPLRSGVEPQYKVQTPQGLPLGSLTLSQLLREAYPGAIYYYMARPYRVVRMDMRDGNLWVCRTKYWTTRPISNTMVFPRFNGGVLSLMGDKRGFLAEAELQVSERVVGFMERRGNTKLPAQLYGPASAYYRRELSRFFESTGVCWRFDDRFDVPDDIGARILQAFCLEFGVQERDLGLGLFHSKESPFGTGGTCQGLCIYDAVSGSLRLTQRLAEAFATVLESASKYAHAEGQITVANQLRKLGRLVEALPQVASANQHPESKPAADSPWTEVIAPGERAIYMSDDGPIEVTVLHYLFTPRGLMYSLQPEHDEGKWMVVANAIQPMHGFTKTIEVDLMTGEIRDESKHHVESVAGAP